MNEAQLARDLFYENNPMHFINFFIFIGNTTLIPMTHLLEILQDMSIGSVPARVELRLDANHYRNFIDAAMVDYDRIDVAMNAVKSKNSNITWDDFERSSDGILSDREEWIAIHAWWDRRPYMLHTYVPPNHDWLVIDFDTAGIAIVIDVGISAVQGTITFQSIANPGEKAVCNIKMIGPSIGLGYDSPKLKSLMPNFGAIANNAARSIATDILIWEGESLRISKFLWRSVSFGSSVIKMIPKTILDIFGKLPMAGVNYVAPWPSWAKGKAFSKGIPMTQADFKGTCFCIAPLNIAATAPTAGLFVLFFGINPSWNPLTELFDMIKGFSPVNVAEELFFPTQVVLNIYLLAKLLDKLHDNSKGVAWFGGASLQASASIEITCTLYYGKIS